MPAGGLPCRLGGGRAEAWGGVQAGARRDAPEDLRGRRLSLAFGGPPGVKGRVCAMGGPEGCPP